MIIFSSSWNGFVNVVALIIQNTKFILAFKHLAEFFLASRLNHSLTKKMSFLLNDAFIVFPPCAN